MLETWAPLPTVNIIEEPGEWGGGWGGERERENTNQHKESKSRLFLI